ncbi:MHYT domain-containing protein [Candidatus Protochlamydia naegleriophila]|uniref:MHYT domain-containing protein n=1 Tax=Candidatus Protochlamydia naegleriophila TaxID=389348 RepID=UPI00138F81B6|nr:MHYT domain-containing protein [Candidatus Protochlamydia naegleriophila]
MKKLVDMLTFLSFIMFIQWSSQVMLGGYPHDYKIGLIILSYVVSVLGSYVGLRLVNMGMVESEIRCRVLWLLMAAIVMGGCTIWAMHFLAMLAFHMGIEVNYDLFLTLFSMLLAMGVAAIGFLFAGLTKMSGFKIAWIGLFMGIGFATMHYMGMAAMIMKASVSYKPLLFWSSIFIAVVASIMALWLMLTVQGCLLRWISAFAIGTGISCFHYIGMAAAVFTPISIQKEVLLEHAIIQQADFVLYLSIAIIFTLAMILFISLQDMKEN